MIASRWFGTTCHLTGTAATQYSRVSPPALPGSACSAIATPAATRGPRARIARGPRRRSHVMRRRRSRPSRRDVDLARPCRGRGSSRRTCTCPGFVNVTDDECGSGTAAGADRHRRGEEAVAVVRAVVGVPALRLRAVDQERRRPGSAPVGPCGIRSVFFCRSLDVLLRAERRRCAARSATCSRT